MEVITEDLMIGLVVATAVLLVLRLGQVVTPGSELAVFAAVALVRSTVHLSNIKVKYMFSVVGQIIMYEK